MTDILDRLELWPYARQGETAYDLIRAAVAEITRLRALTTPQPIETAPKDGTQILVEGYDAGDNFGWRQSRWTPAGYWAWTADAKRWLPLPEVPK